MDEPTEVESHVRGMFGRDSLYMLMWGIQLGGAALFTPITTRLLGAAKYGRVAVAVAVMQVVFSVANLSIQSAIQRVYADRGLAAARRLLSFAIVLSVVVTLAANASGPIWSKALGLGHYGGAIQIGVVLAGISATTDACLGLLRSQDLLLPFCIVSLFQSVMAEVFSVAIVLGVGHTATNYMLGQLFAQIIATVMGLWFAPPLRPRRGDGQLIAKALRFCLPLVPGALAAFVMTSVDRIVIQGDLGATDVGRYQVAYNVGSMAIILLGVLNSAWMPRIFSITDDATQASVLAESRDAVYRLLIPVMLAASVDAPVLLRIWVPSSYRPDSLLLVVTIVVVTAAPFASSLAHTRVLLSTGRTTTLAWTILVAAGINIGLNVLLVPRWHLPGSALATLISYLVLSALIRQRADRVLRLEPMPRILVAQLAVAIGVAFLWSRGSTTPKWLAVRIVLGVACVIWFAVGAAHLSGRSIRLGRRKSYLHSRRSRGRRDRRPSEGLPHDRMSPSPRSGWYEKTPHLRRRSRSH